MRFILYTLSFSTTVIILTTVLFTALLEGEPSTTIQKKLMIANSITTLLIDHILEEQQQYNLVQFAQAQEYPNIEQNSITSGSNITEQSKQEPSTCEECFTNNLRKESLMIFIKAMLGLDFEEESTIVPKSEQKEFTLASQVEDPFSNLEEALIAVCKLLRTNQPLQEKLMKDTLIPLGIPEEELNKLFECLKTINIKFANTQ